MKIRKAIIPVAGLGTRFLPATKAIPKGLLPVVDKPIIQLIVEEVVAAGIKEIIFVSSQNTSLIESYFDSNYELEHRLEEKNKIKELEQVRAISQLASFASVRQLEPKGDGHAILQAKNLIGDEPCAVIFSDDVVDNKIPAIGQLIDIYEKYGNPVIGVQHIPKKDVSKYGIIDGHQIADRTYEVTNFIEKPNIEEAPTDLAVLARYIITPDVMKALETAPTGKGGEIRLADAFISLLDQRTINAYDFEGARYDCGNKLQYLIAAVDYGLKHEEVNGDGEFTKFIKQRAASLK